MGNNGWGTAIASYLAAIHQEFNKRGIDFSQIGKATELSFKNKIELIEKVIKIKIEYLLPIITSFLSRCRFSPREDEKCRL